MYFKTGALNHSAILPVKLDQALSRVCCKNKSSVGPNLVFDFLKSPLRCCQWLQPHRHRPWCSAWRSEVGRHQRRIGREGYHVEGLRRVVHQGGRRGHCALVCIALKRTRAINKDQSVISFGSKRFSDLRSRSRPSRYIFRRRREIISRTPYPEEGKANYEDQDDEWHHLRNNTPCWDLYLKSSAITLIPPAKFQNQTITVQPNETTDHRNQQKERQDNAAKQ